MDSPSARSRWFPVPVVIGVVGAIVLGITVWQLVGSGANHSTTVRSTRPSHATTIPSPSSSATAIHCTVSVTEYGADTAAANNASAFQAAIDAGVGGTVCIPVGTWKVESQIVIPAAEVLAGAGASSTTLVQMTHGHNLLQVRGDGTVVEDLTLDTQTNNGGIAFSTGGSHVTLRDADVLSGNVPGHFAIYFAGPRGSTVTAPRYATANVMENVAVSDQICDDGVSWSFQTNGTIDNVSETGSRLALYVDDGTNVNGYKYTPGPCVTQDSGYWITPPSQNITINGFVSSGAAGEICPNVAKSRPCSNIAVDGEEAPSGTLHVGDVTELTVQDSTVERVLIVTSTGATGHWLSSYPVTAQCIGDPISIAGLRC